jgi:hypothetical protein
MPALLSIGCSVPRRIWSGDDIEPSELHEPSAGNRVLVAALSSEFKDALVARVKSDFADEPVYIKFIGLDDLDEEHAADYAAVVLINSCIAWGLSPKVDSFLERHDSLETVIVLTTSGDGGWLPDKKGRSYDAIATASVPADVDAVADALAAKIRAILAGG